MDVQNNYLNYTDFGLIRILSKLGGSYIWGIGSREKFSMPQYENPVIYPNNCRYKNVRTIRDTERNRLHHETINKPFVALSEQDEYITVKDTEENRLDIISNNFYGTPRYWWAIAYANYIIDPFDVPRGTRLRIPPIVSLHRIGGVLSGSR